MSKISQAKDLGLRIARQRFKTGADVFVLSNGFIGTAVSIWKSAKEKGFDGTSWAMAQRLKSGCRDFAELCAPVNAVLSETRKAESKKRKEDPEFIAALAAVNARRGKR